MKNKIIGIVVWMLLVLVYYYFLLPPINVQSISFWGFVVFILIMIKVSLILMIVVLLWKLGIMKLMMIILN